MLDYLGRSANTGSPRNISQYVFKGVDINGNVNTKPVDFTSPTQAVETNRWTRYGWTGITEEYIQNTSWFRMSELVVSYSTKNSGQRSLIKEATFSLIGRNLFLVTPYHGVDPAANLFGYSTGTGLDLFNTPNTRSYSALITFKF